MSVFGFILVCIFPAFSCIRTEYGEIRSIKYLFVFSQIAGKCGKNADQNNSEYGHFLRSDGEISNLSILSRKNCVLLNSRMVVWPLLIFFICLHDQLSSIYVLLSRIKEYGCLKYWIYKIDSKNEWLLLSASFTAKFGFVFVLTQKNPFS